MKKTNISFKDVEYALLNNQIIATGDTAVSKENVVFFVGYIGGSGITVKDGGGNTVMSSAGVYESHYPLRFDGGFDISGTNVNIVYTEIAIIPD